MATIGAFTVGVYQGRLSFAEPDAKLYRQPGILGWGSVYGAYRTGDADVIVTKDRASNTAAAITLGNSYRLLNKTFVTVVEPTGLTFTNVEILAVQPMFMLDPLGAVLVCRWKMIPASAAPV